MSASRRVANVGSNTWNPDIKTVAINITKDYLGWLGGFIKVPGEMSFG
jgi:hypothetical protein